MSELGQILFIAGMLLSVILFVGKITVYLWQNIAPTYPFVTDITEILESKDYHDELLREWEIVRNIKRDVDSFIFSKQSRGLILEVFEVQIDAILEKNGYYELSEFTKAYVDGYWRRLAQEASYYE